jgi:hypothetical protein
LGINAASGKSSRPAKKHFVDFIKLPFYGCVESKEWARSFGCSGRKR